MVMMKMSEERCDAVIIGDGPAGLSAALYALRGKLKVLMLECDAPGGNVLKTDKINNYPGFLSVSGPDLAYEMYNQVMALNLDYRYGKVVDIIDHNEYKEVICDDNTYN